MKDYAKFAGTAREERVVERTAPQPKANLIHSAKELQTKEGQENKNIFSIFLILFILAAVGYGIIHQYFSNHHFAGTHARTSSGMQARNNNATGAQDNVPQFDFYTVLPKGATANDQATAATPNAAANNNTSTSSAATSAAQAAPSAQVSVPVPPPKPQAPVTTINVSANNAAKYYLNVGDYTTDSDAQQMLSQLLLLGVPASVALKQNNNNTAYEVIVGPFADQDAMSVVKNQLSSHQINTTVIQQ
jgi:cell division septation protein DedD